MKTDIKHGRELIHNLRISVRGLPATFRADEFGGAGLENDCPVMNVERQRGYRFCKVDLTESEFADVRAAADHYINRFCRRRERNEQVHPAFRKLLNTISA